MGQPIQIKRGNAANLPELLSGELGVALDTKDVYIGTPSGNVQVGGNSIASQLADIAYNIKKFGAKCDGVTDDTQAWLDTYNALPSRGGKILVPVTGKTKISSHLIFTKTITIEGLGTNFSSDLGSCLLFEGAGEITLQGGCSGAYNLIIDGLTGNTGNGINFACGWSHGANINVIGQGGHGIVIGSETLNQNYNGFNFSNLNARDNGGHGVLLAHPSAELADCNIGIIHGVKSQGNVGDGLRLQNANDNTFTAVSVLLNDNGIKLINSDANIFFNPYMEGHTTKDIYMDVTSDGNKVMGTNEGFWAFEDKIVNLGSRNMFFVKDQAKFDENILMGALYFEETGISKHGAPGYWKSVQNVNGNLEMNYVGGGNTNVEFINGGGTTNLKIDSVTIGGTNSITNVIHAMGLLNFGSSIPAHTSIDRNLLANGAKVGDFVQVSLTDSTLPLGLLLSGYVTMDNYITVYISNVTTATITYGERAYKALATRAI